MQTFLQILWHDLAATSFLEYFAVLFGVLSVWFASRENIWVYPTGIINVALYVYLFVVARLYAQASLQVYYLIMSIWGWYNWMNHPSEEGNSAITRLDRKGWWLAIALVAAGSVVLYFVLKEFTNSPVPFLDGFTTAIFFVTMWLMALKKAENWLGWIIGDLMLIPLSISQHLAFTSVQYLVFLGIAISGWISWNKKMKHAHSLA